MWTVLKTSRFLFFCLLLSLFNCSPDFEERATEIIAHSSQGDFLKMHSNQATLTVVGGQAWDFGEIWELDNDGFNLRHRAPVSYTNVRYDHTRDAIISVGMNGIFTIITDTIRAINHREGIITRDVLPLPEYDLIVGGKSNKLGYLIGINTKVGFEPETRFDHEIRSIGRLDNTLFAAGFGIALRSNDNGQTWEILQPEGDFYVSIQTIKSHIYLIGQEGQLQVSTDLGDSWSKIKVPANQRINYARAIGSNLHLLGEDGQVQTYNSQDQTWELLKLGDSNLFDIALYNDNLYVCGEDGYFAKILD